jgi:cytochrome c oxidase subunit 2
MRTQDRKVQVAHRARQQRIRAISFGVIVVLVLTAAGVLLASAFSPRTPSPMAGNVIDIAADMSGFSIKEMHVKVGQPVTVRLTSLDGPHHTDGGGKHQWAVDELDVSILAPSMGSSLATFTPNKPGTYTFYCDICCGGRANPSMQGKLIIEG